jgi:hypothetical protein
MIRLSLFLTCLSVLCGPARAADTPAKSAPETTAAARAQPAKPAQIRPTLANVPYGEHQRQVLDFWKAESPRPTPVLFHYLIERLAAGRD